MKRLQDKVNFSKEELMQIGFHSFTAYDDVDVSLSLKSKPIEELIIFSSIHSLKERKIELDNKLKSIKYNLNLRCINVEEDKEYLDIESRLSEINMFLDKLEMNSPYQGK